MRPGPTTAQRRADVRLGLVLAAATAASTELARSFGYSLPQSPPALEQLAWALAISLPLCVRRRYPVAVLLVVSATFIALQARLVLEGTMTSICLFVALYTAGAWARDRRVATAARLVVVVAMFAWLVIGFSATPLSAMLPGTDSDQTGFLPPRAATVVYATALNVVYFAGAWMFGDAAWRDARSRAALAASNEQLRRSREENARRAVLDERVRIARELHDVVAHHVSTMGVQAGAARRVLDTSPDDARAAMAAVEASSRAAVEEMRRLLGVLRAGDAPHGPDALDGGPGPAPDLRCLPQLVAEPRGGLQVDHAEVGTPRPVPPSTSVSAYRVVQEALTNVVRHAGARRASVRLRWLSGAVEVEVVDDGRAAPSGGGGLGLVGMRERLALHGGLLDVGPRPDGGWRVRARFPLPEDA
ncbi:sensor histidine kinase [Quadrisphaera sp. DSM 44207]|uniref:sensor histidine kinase n=1 Tax=Quadrisphaera sp. DSM 44207 TaxID=1881057 RepID=UPI00088194DF|nr:Signal transduction histidine kinase [Quadrisphaera sp. DSM 44207]